MGPRAPECSWGEGQPGPWMGLNLELGWGSIWTRDMDYGTWTRDMDYGTWTRGMDHGTWTRDMDHGTWTMDMDHGTWAKDMDHGTWTRDMAVPGPGTGLNLESLVALCH